MSLISTILFSWTLHSVSFLFLSFFLSLFLSFLYYCSSSSFEMANFFPPPFVAPYFQNCLSEEDLNEMNIELIRNTIYKAYLEDFYRYCKELGGATAEIMSELLEFEADRRAINITINSFGTELGKDDREKLYPSFGVLYPDAQSKLAKADDIEQVRGAVDFYGVNILCILSIRMIEMIMINLSPVIRF
eukprot:TRINITY_DN507_c0_g1_i16.p1 TRINITY_DN507_c0_g1~~TRINITY_DN507_c0_g1_i16.p1  ORF type:complete len:189 (-),score=22.68 TRINITY_DN507_c0_g1_i16:18-584(-)